MRKLRKEGKWEALPVVEHAASHVNNIVRDLKGWRDEMRKDGKGASLFLGQHPGRHAN